MDKGEVNTGWESLKEFPKINKNHIQVWKIYIPDYFHRLKKFERFLNTNERKRSASIKFEDQKRNFIVSRGILRILLSCFFSENPENLKFKSTLYGKPSLDEKHHQNEYKYNLSRSGEICLIAISRNINIGVDIEAIKLLPNIEEMAKKFLSQEELVHFHSFSNEEQHTAFYNFWSSKEALLKLLGCGLLIEPNHIEIKKIIEKKIVSAHLGSTVFDLSQTELIAVDGINGYVGWLATDRKAEAIRKIELSNQFLPF